MSYKVTISHCISVYCSALFYSMELLCQLGLQGRAIQSSDLGTFPSGFAWGLLKSSETSVGITSIFILILSLLGHSSCSLFGVTPLYFSLSINLLPQLYKDQAPARMWTGTNLDVNRHLLWQQAFSFVCFLKKGTKKAQFFSCSKKNRNNKKSW